jgi:ABC-2 type transport system ATP-binding protein
MSIIMIRDLKKYYGKNRGIESVTFDVEEGEIYGFIGPNGSGKSTTIKILLNLLFADAGEAKIFGLDPAVDGAKIKAKLGFVPGEVRYYPDMRVRELLDTTLRFHQLTSAGCKDRIDELSDIFEIDLDKKFGALSLGNKKKISIAQALIHKPELIILDEPTNGLDPLMQKNLFAFLKKVNEQGTTVLFSSHNLSEVQENCGRAAFIKEGRIIEIDDLHSSAQKQKIITVSFRTAKEFSLPDKLVGATHVRSMGNGEYVFSYQGDTKPILSYLNTLAPDDILIENASLESRFMAFYEGGNSK